MIPKLLLFFLVGLVAVVVGGVALSILGTVFSLGLSAAGFLLFKVAPLMLLGWVVVKLVQRSRDRDRLSAADRRWLEEG